MKMLTKAETKAKLAARAKAKVNAPAPASPVKADAPNETKQPPVLTGVSLADITTKSGGGGKDKGIGRLTETLLAECVAIVDGQKIGWSYEEVLEKVREAKGNQHSSKKCIVWYKSKLRKERKPGGNDIVVPKTRTDILLAAQQSDDAAQSDDTAQSDTDGAITDPKAVAAAEKALERESDTNLAKS